MDEQSQWHSVSRFNADPRVTDALAFPTPLRIFDSTLRKILLTPGISPPTDELLEIAAALDRAGVRDVVLNVHWWGDSRPNKREWALLAAVLEGGFGFDVTVYADATLPREGNAISPRDALDQVRALGAQTIELPYLLPRADGRGPSGSPDELHGLCAHAHSIGLAPVLGLSDVGRADFGRATQVANQAIELGCLRISLLDSYSSMSVEAMTLFCNEFRRHLERPVDLSMHVHNDFGLGSALALAAAGGGVNPDVSVNSVSYRSGFAALQEVVTALEVLYDVRTGIDLRQLQSLADLVTRCTGLSNLMHPITGPHQYLRDDPEGILDYLRDGPDSFPVATSCLAPALTGGHVTAVWGDRHATSTVRAKLGQLGLPAGRELVELVYRSIEQAVDARTSYPRWLSEAEVDALCRSAAAELGLG